MGLGRKKNADKPEKPSKEKRGKKARPAKTGKTKAEKKGAKKAKFRSGSRFVLFVGDEGSILLYMRDNMVVSRQFVPDASEQNLAELRTSLDKDPKAPFSMAIDSLDQSYVQQALPPVSSMSVKKLIQRRLERDFGPEDIKGAILLGRDEGGRKDWNFLMVSVERSRQISMWLDFAFTLPNRFTGIYLVSVETEIILRNIERALGVEKTGAGAKWKFFISHNKVGGFRQVVLHKGRIIFTRMAQPIGEATPEVLAGNIEQEMQSTMEYMKRLAYDPADGLDIYIVGANALKPVIDKSKFKSSSFTIMTPFEVAQLLGIEGATQPTDQFGDVILAASIASSPQHVLRLTTPESRRFDKLYSIFKAQRMAGALAILGMIGYAGMIATDIYMSYAEADEMIVAKNQHQTTLDTLKDEIKKSNLDVEKMSNIIELYQLLLKQQVSPLNFIARVETAIKPPVMIKNIDWRIEDKNGTVIYPKPKATAVLLLSFPEVHNVLEWRQTSKQILADLKLVFRNYDIAFSKVPQRFTGDDKMDLSFDSNNAVPKSQPVKEDSDVTLTIREL